MADCFHCTRLPGCAEAAVGSICPNFDPTSEPSARDFITSALGDVAALAAGKRAPKEKSAMSTPEQSQAVLDAVENKDVTFIEGLREDMGIKTTFLMIAASKLLDPRDLGKRCAKASPADRRGIVIDALVEVANSSPAPMTPQVDVSNVDAEVVERAAEAAEAAEAAPAPAPKPKRRRRTKAQMEAARAAEAAAAKAASVEAPPPPAEQAPAAAPADLGPVLSYLEDISKKVTGLDNGIPVDIAELKASAARTEKAVEGTLAMSEAAANELKTLNAKIEVFKDAVIELEQAMVLGGLIQSAPFTEAMERWPSEKIPF